MWAYRCSRIDRLFVAQKRFVDGALSADADVFDFDCTTTENRGGWRKIEQG